MMGADGHVHLVQTGPDAKDRRQSVSLSQWNVPHSSVFSDRASGSIIVPIVSSLNDVAAVGADADAALLSQSVAAAPVGPSSLKEAMIRG